MALHTWEFEFARQLLHAAGYKTMVGKGGFIILPSAYNINSDTIKAESDGRISSAKIRDYLDHPISLGGMRINVQPRSVVEFGE